MSQRAWIVWMAALSILPMACGGGSDDDANPAGPQGEVVGDWVQSAVTCQGNPAERVDVKVMDRLLASFHPSVVRFNRDGRLEAFQPLGTGKSVASGSYRRVDGEPDALDFSLPGPSGDPVPLRARYRASGDVLRLCLGFDAAKRPGEFGSEDKPSQADQYVIQFRKAESSDPGVAQLDEALRAARPPDAPAPPAAPR
jgi:hypothetical protein